MSDDDPNMRGVSRRHVVAACEASLRRLQTDWIDLYQLHRPRSDTAIDETLRALDDLVRQGKVRYIGCSNYAAWQIADAAWTARVRHLNSFISVQNRYSVMTRELEREVVPAVTAHGLGVLPYFPLESGLLSGKYVPGKDFPADSRLAKWGGFATSAFASPDKLEKLGRLYQLCERYDHTLLHLAMGWLASKPYVSASSPALPRWRSSSRTWRPRAGGAARRRPNSIDVSRVLLLPSAGLVQP